MRYITEGEVKICLVLSGRENRPPRSRYSFKASTLLTNELENMIHKWTVELLNTVYH